VHAGNRNLLQLTLRRYYISTCWVSQLVARVPYITKLDVSATTMSQHYCRLFKTKSSSCTRVYCGIQRWSCYPAR